MKLEVVKVWIDAKCINIQLADGSIGRECIANYPPLKSATRTQIENYTLSATGIHWAELDEDLCFEGFFNKPAIPEFAQKLKNIQGLNASQLARRMGISQSLFAAYLCGKKTPSEARRKDIEIELHRLGQELCSIRL